MKSFELKSFEKLGEIKKYKIVLIEEIKDLEKYTFFYKIINDIGIDALLSYHLGNRKNLVFFKDHDYVYKLYSKPDDLFIIGSFKKSFLFKSDNHDQIKLNTKKYFFTTNGSSKRGFYIFRKDRNKFINKEVLYE